MFCPCMGALLPVSRIPAIAFTTRPASSAAASTMSNCTKCGLSSYSM